MRDLWENGILGRILILMIITALLGISPLPHEVELGMVKAGRAQLFDAPKDTAQNLALIARHLPWRGDLWEQAAHLALAGDDPENAVRFFKEAAAIGDLSHDGYLRFGDAYVGLGNTHTAMQIWEAGIHIFGSSEGSLNRLADVQRDMGDYPALVDTLKALLMLHTSDPGHPSPLIDLNYELGMLLAADDPASAPPYLLQAVELSPELTDANELAFAIQRALPNDNPTYTLMEAGRKLATLNKWPLAVHAFRRVTEAMPDYGEAWAYLGEALQHLEDPAAEGEAAAEDAYQVLGKAIALDPQSLPANIFMTLYWQRGGDPDLAYKYLSIAAEIDPGNPDILVDLGSAAAILGDLEAGYAYYRNAIEVTSSNPVYLRRLVEFCIRYNYSLDEVALPVARQALSSDPDDPASLDVMGQVLFRLGDLLNAERFLLRAIRQDPNYAPAHLHLGMVYNLQDKTSLAYQEFAKAITLAPGTSTATLAQRYFDNLSTP
jgi:tetratricopeptide (TPR) repeat protein